MCKYCRNRETLQHIHDDLLFFSYTTSPLSVISFNNCFDIISMLYFLKHNSIKSCRYKFMHADAVSANN